MGDFPKGKFSLIARPEERATFQNSYEGLKVYVVNCTNKAIMFSTQDSRLYMKMQAMDKNGEWKDIEYLPSSWCGNSYYTINLDPEAYWTFIVPAYHGDFKTRMRIVLNYVDPSDKNEQRYKRKEIAIYSNEFEGSVNPGQFWRKNSYTTQGIMDPYND